MRIVQTGLVRRAGAIAGAVSVAALALAACGQAAPSAASRPTAVVQAAKPTAAPAKPTAAVKPTEAAKPTAVVKPTEAAKPTVAAAQPTAALKPTEVAKTAEPQASWEPRAVAGKVTLTGDGAAVPAPLYQAWIESYTKAMPNLTIIYKGAGNGQGVAGLTAGQIDFGASDALLTDVQLKDAPGTLQVPTALDAVAITYNLAGVTDLRLSPAVLAGIFDGTITSWSDPKIAADNLGLTLPKLPIAVIHRSDASSSTAIFSDYLSSVSPDWKAKIGAGATVTWPVGSAAAGSAGVAQAVEKTSGAIGYVEQTFALGHTPLAVAAIKNASGDFVMPNAASIRAAAESAGPNLPPDLRLSIVNPSNSKQAYPISGLTYVLLRPEMKDSAKAQALTDFLYWGLTSGEMELQALHYVPLTPDIQQRAVQLLGKVMVGGKAAFQPPHAA